MSSLPEKPVIRVSKDPYGELSPIEHAIFQAHVDVFCQRFGSLAPTAFRGLMLLAERYSQIELDDEYRMVHDLTSDVTAWVQRFRMDAPWAVEVGIRTMQVARSVSRRGLPLPETLVHSVAVQEVEGDRELLWIEAQTEIVVPLEFEMDNLGWIPAIESLGRYIERLKSEVADQARAQLNVKKNPVDFPKHRIDWLIETRVNEESVNGISERTNVPRSTITKGIQDVESILFPLAPSRQKAAR